MVRARLGDDNRDCGYWGSARMVLEAALCIAMDVGLCNLIAVGCESLLESLTPPQHFRAVEFGPQNIAVQIHDYKLPTMRVA